MFSTEGGGEGRAREGLGGERGDGGGCADTRKSGVAEMGKREEREKSEERREVEERLAGDTGTSIIHVVCLLHLLPPFVVFHDLRSL